MERDQAMIIVDTICHEAQMVREAFQDMAAEQARPSALFRPKIYIDGNAWCALYGENIQDGVAGFGRSPEDALRDFDRVFSQRLAPPNSNKGG